MSLGLFNCRLIQPAGDQLFFFVGCLAAPLPVRASSVQSPCDPSCSAPTNGRAQNASCLSFSERFCFGFQRGEVPSGAEGFTPNDSPANFPEDPPILPTDSATDPEIYLDSESLFAHYCLAVVARSSKHELRNSRIYRQLISYRQLIRRTSYACKPHVSGRLHRGVVEWCPHNKRRLHVDSGVRRLGGAGADRSGNACDKLGGIFKHSSAGSTPEVISAIP